ncbi:MAG TPA: tRNA pseudouridine(55) synthase TruB [Nitrospirota bacterium]|nr:tRNA pseudouridine(55) synthase TruB [Nitrospirota bacterium]
MDGVVNIHKSPGMTSHDVVQKVRLILKEKRIGHTGTLDPLATGVLVLCVGRATRIAQYLEAGEKEYQAVMCLGVKTDTQDAAGRVLETQSYDPPARETILEALQGFTGTIMQRPPAYSAVKVAGVPSYKLAREGKAEPLKPRQVKIYEIVLTDYDDPFVSFTVRCSKGVYIRTLCADIGAMLGMGSHLAGLVRTRSGRFIIEQSVTLDELADMAGESVMEKALMSTNEALADFPMVLINEMETTRIMHGNRVPCPGYLASNKSDLVRLQDYGGRLVAIARVAAGMLKPELVFS